MKRIISVICSFVFIFSLCVPALAEEKVGKFSVKDVSAKQGNTISVDVELSSNPGITACGIKVEYDSKVISLEKGENGEVFPSLYMTSRTIDVNPYIMMWLVPLAKENITTDGILAKLTFKVLDGAENGNTTIKIISDDHNIFNVNLRDRAVAGCSFDIKIDNGKYTEIDKVDQLPVTATPDYSDESSKVSATGSVTQNSANNSAQTNNANNSDKTVSNDVAVDAEGNDVVSESTSDAANTNESQNSYIWLYVIIIAVAVAAVVVGVLLVSKKGKNSVTDEPNKDEPEKEKIISENDDDLPDSESVKEDSNPENKE